jgi:hypothetical protein
VTLTPVIDHQGAEANAVDQHDAAVDHYRVVVGVFGEIRRGDENPFLRALSLKSTSGFLDFRRPTVPSQRFACT